MTSQSSANQERKIVFVANAGPVTNIKNYGGQVHVHNNHGYTAPCLPYSQCAYVMPGAWSFGEYQMSTQATNAGIAHRVQTQAAQAIKLLAQIYATSVKPADYAAVSNTLEDLSIPADSVFDAVREALDARKAAVHSAKAADLLAKISGASTQAAEYANSMKMLQALTIPANEHFDGVREAMGDIKFAIQTAKEIQDTITAGIAEQAQAQSVQAIELLMQIGNIPTDAAHYGSALEALRAISIPADAAFNGIREAVDAHVVDAQTSRAVALLAQINSISIQSEISHQTQLTLLNSLSIPGDTCFAGVLDAAKDLKSTIVLAQIMQELAQEAQDIDAAETLAPSQPAKTQGHDEVQTSGDYYGDDSYYVQG